MGWSEIEFQGWKILAHIIHWSNKNDSRKSHLFCCTLLDQLCQNTWSEIFNSSAWQWAEGKEKKEKKHLAFPHTRLLAVKWQQLWEGNSRSTEGTSDLTRAWLSTYIQTWQTWLQHFSFSPWTHWALRVLSTLQEQTFFCLFLSCISSFQIFAAAPLPSPYSLLIPNTMTALFRYLCQCTLQAAPLLTPAISFLVQTSTLHIFPRFFSKHSNAQVSQYTLFCSPAQLLEPTHISPVGDGSLAAWCSKPCCWLRCFSLTLSAHQGKWMHGQEQTCAGWFPEPCQPSLAVTWYN